MAEQQTGEYTSSVQSWNGGSEAAPLYDHRNKEGINNSELHSTDAANHARRTFFLNTAAF